MSVDYFHCEKPGCHRDPIPDCDLQQAFDEDGTLFDPDFGPVCCGGCGSVFCSIEHGSLRLPPRPEKGQALDPIGDFLGEDEPDFDESSMTCVICRRDDFPDEKLLEHALEKLKTTRAELVASLKETRR